MNLYSFELDQEGHTLTPDADHGPGPQHFTAVRLIKNGDGGIAFAKAKDEVLGALRRQLQQVAGQPDEERRTHGLIDKVEGLDEGSAQRMPDGENWL